MKQKKVHLCKGGTNVCVCGFETYDAYHIRNFDRFILTPEEERCKSCENTKYFAEMLAKKESERELDENEWDESFLNLKKNEEYTKNLEREELKSEDLPFGKKSSSTWNVRR